MNTLKQFRKDIKKAIHVFGSVWITRDDSHYFQMIKKDLLAEMEHWDENTMIQYEIRDNDIYIN
jgi:hypothetical protein